MRNSFEPGDLVRVINTYAVYDQDEERLLRFQGYVRPFEVLLVVGGVLFEFDAVFVRVISRFGVGYVNSLALETL